MTFNELNIAEPILKAVCEKGYNEPTPIQEQAIPVVLRGKDIFGIAMYDSGDKKIIALKIKNYLDEMFRTNITNQLLAARFGFVPSYIVSIFKTYYGLTPMDYLVKTRIDESKFLLVNSSLKIKEIASEVGYEDSLYFSKVFKKITGVSPKEYIRSEKID